MKFQLLWRENCTIIGNVYEEEKIPEENEERNYANSSSDEVEILEQPGPNITILDFNDRSLEFEV